MTLHYDAHTLQKANVESAVRNQLMNSFKRRMIVIIKRQKRLTAIQDKVDLMTTKLIEVEANKQMMKFMKQIDDKKDIQNHQIS